MFKVTGFMIVTGTYTPPDRPNVSYPYETIKFAFLTDENSKFTGLATAKEGMGLISVPRKKLLDVSGYDSPEKLINKTFSLVYGVSYGKPVLEKMVEIKAQ